MNGDGTTEGSIEDAASDGRHRRRITGIEWGGAGGDEFGTEGRGYDGEGSASSGGGSGGGSARLGSPSGKPQAKRGPKPGATRLAADAAVRERIRGRLEEQLQALVIFLFFQLGLWKARKYAFDPQLAELVSTCYHVPDESALEVAKPASHCIAKHLPAQVVETATDVLDPITVVSTGYGIYQSIQQQEKKVVADYLQASKMTRRIPRQPKPLVPEYPNEQEVQAEVKLPDEAGGGTFTTSLY